MATGIESGASCSPAKRRVETPDRSRPNAEFPRILDAIHGETPWAPGDPSPAIHGRAFGPARALARKRRASPCKMGLSSAGLFP
jgi:hypothetical protein